MKAPAICPNRVSVRPLATEVKAPMPRSAGSVPSAKTDMTAADCNFIRSTWGVAKSAFVLVTTSRLVHKNGVDTLIESLNDLPSDVVLVVAGAGEDEEKLKFQVLSYKLQDRVIFLGHIDHNMLPRVLKAADVFVRPSRSEGLGISFLEAMAADLPVIGTHVGGIVDFIKDGKTGLLIAPDNTVELTAAIKKLYEDKGVNVEIFELAGKSQWQKIFSSILIADWTSFYLAEGYGLNPEAVPIIQNLKKMLK